MGGLLAVATVAVALSCSWAVALCCVMPAALVLCWWRMWLFAAIPVCFLLLTVGHRHVYIRPAMALDGEIDTLTGTIVDQPTRDGMHTLRVIDSDYLPKGSLVMITVSDEAVPALYDTITQRTELVPIKDSQTYYAAHGAFACGFAVDDHATVIHHDTEVSVIKRCRTALVGVVRAALPADESGVLSALCFGQRDYVNPADESAFRGSGLSHLLVVSGLHLSLVALAIHRLFRRFGMVACNLMTIGGLWLFALLVGLSPSVLRAAMMVTVWLVGCLLFCRSDGLNALGLAAILLLAYHPYTLLDAGFQLSFAATMGVLALAHRLLPYTSLPDEGSRWMRLWRWVRLTVKNSVVVCVSALLFSLPIACYHYGGMPLLSLLSNPLAAPAAGGAMLFGWLGALIGRIPFMGWLSNGCLLIAGLLVRYMTAVAKLCSPSWAWLPVASGWRWLLLCAVCAVCICGILWRIPWRRVGVAALALAVLTAAVGTFVVDVPLRLTVVPVDNESGFILQQGNHCALIITAVRDINEVVYDAAPFEPDVLFILDGDASAVSQAGRWTEATVIAATPATWAQSSRIPIDYCAVGETVELWEECSLTRLSDGWTLLMMGEDAVCIATAPDEPCPYPDGWQIYVGCAPTQPTAHYTVVCSAAWWRRNATTLVGRATVFCDEIRTFTPHEGEWRELPWQ